MRSLVLSLTLMSPVAALAQSNLVTSDSPAPQPLAGSNWQHVQILPAGTSIHVKAGHHSSSCKVKTVDADSLVCFSGKDVVIQREDIQSVKVAHRGRSTLAGAGLGIGLGAIVGAISYGKGCATTQSNSLFGCFDIINRTTFAMLGGVAGGLIGTPVGYFTDMTGSTIYKAPPRK